MKHEILYLDDEKCISCKEQFKQGACNTFFLDPHLLTEMTTVEEVRRAKFIGMIEHGAFTGQRAWVEHNDKDWHGRLICQGCYAKHLKQLMQVLENAQ